MNSDFTKPPPDGLPMSTVVTTYGPSDPTRQSSCASRRTAPTPPVKLEFPTGMETVYTVSPQQLTRAMVQLPRTPEQSPFASMAVAASSPVLKAEGSQQQQQLYMADQSCFQAQTVNGNDFQYHALHSPPMNSVYPPQQQACSVQSSSPRSWCSPVAEQHCYPVSMTPIITSFPRGSNNVSFTSTQSSCSPSMPPSPYSVISEADITHHHLPGSCLETQHPDNHQYHQAYSYEESPTMMTAMDESSLPYNTAGMGGGVDGGSFQQPLSPCSSTLGLGQQPGDDDLLVADGADFSLCSSNNNSHSSNSSKQHEEPYAQLIYRALMTTAPRHAMTLQEIYTWFKENTEKGRDGTKGWQNSVRHNLSMNKAFTKRDCKSTGKSASGASASDGAAEPAETFSSGDAVEQEDGGAGDNTADSSANNDRESSSKKGTTEWVLEPWAIRDGVQSTTRYRKGHMARSAARGNNTSNIKPHHLRIGGRDHHDYHRGRKGMVMTRRINKAAAAASAAASSRNHHGIKEPAWLRNAVTVPIDLSHYNTLHPQFPGYLPEQYGPEDYTQQQQQQQQQHQVYMPAAANTTPEPQIIDVDEPVTPEPNPITSFTNGHGQPKAMLLLQQQYPTQNNINMMQSYGVYHDEEQQYGAGGWSGGSSDDGHGHGQCAVSVVHSVDMSELLPLYQHHNPRHQHHQPY
ncbi:hypothetical protein QBC46DRAFT_451160 [Diplogelasinospora grovesii]|uniref:Fork-head domain-containing protein n=1 Tax=Diplogelasinospora grovesii TaxID=303347 RepID=A0AAN6N3E7_9PEZI|nr:hypothetical protein QBC46DRAFT_451160 [Diplogelasinospora grovesii]